MFWWQPNVAGQQLYHPGTEFRTSGCDPARDFERCSLHRHRLGNRRPGESAQLVFRKEDVHLHLDMLARHKLNHGLCHPLHGNSAND